MPRRRACGPGARSSTASCATCPPSPRTASRSRCSSMPASWSTCRISTETGAAGRRPVPHRAAVHDRRAHALGGRAAGALQRRVRRGRRQARHLPHPRHRRRQDPALHAVRRGGEPGARLARHPHRPRPAGPAARPGPRPAEGRRRAAPEDHVPDGRDLRRVRARQGDRASARRPISPATATRCRPSLKLGVMLEVPSLLFQIKEICASADFVSVGSNDLMQFLFAADRENRRVADRFDPLSAPVAAGPEARRRARRRRRLPGDGLRRDRRQAARGHGADRPRLPLAVHVARPPSAR